MWDGSLEQQGPHTSHHAFTPQGPGERRSVYVSHSPRIEQTQNICSLWNVWHWIVVALSVQHLTLCLCVCVCVCGLYETKHIFCPWWETNPSLSSTSSFELFFFSVLWNTSNYKKSQGRERYDHEARHAAASPWWDSSKRAASGSSFPPAAPSGDMPCGTLPLAPADLNAMRQPVGSKTGRSLTSRTSYTTGGTTEPPPPPTSAWRRSR